MIEGLTVGNDVEQENEFDSLGVSFLKETGIYSVSISMAYQDISPKGAKFIHFEFKGADGFEYKEDIYFTNRSGENFYICKRTGKKRALPGLTSITSIIASFGFKIADLKVQEKLVKRWNKAKGKEEPTLTNVLVDLLNAKGHIAIMKQIEDHWENPTNIVEKNTIVKSFNEAKLTNPEVEAGTKEPLFANAWEDRYDSDYFADKRKSKALNQAAYEEYKKTGMVPTAVVEGTDVVDSVEFDDDIPF